MEVTKPKNLGRVAAGKRTTEIKRKRKEDLLRNQTVPPQVDSGTDSVPIGGGDSWKYGGGAVEILVGLGFALYLYCRKKPISVTHPIESNDDIFFIN